MEFGFSEDEESFRQEISAFLRREVTEQVVKERESGMVPGSYTWDVVRKLGARRWLVPHWPKEYGGLGASPMCRLIVQEEMDYHGDWPNEGLPGVGVAGPIIMLYGSEEQKKEYLPQIARGDIEFAVGYTEPQAGSDLSALAIRAVEEGDEYIINGQKVFNTHCHYADYHWLAARTDPNVPKHRGISLFIVDLKSPGITIRPIWTLAGWRTNEVFYDNVRVPKRNLVGEKNRGFYYLTTALDLERTWPVGSLQRSLEGLVEYAREKRRDGKPLAEDPLVRYKLAEIAMEVEVARVLSYRVAWMQAKGAIPNYEAAMLKLFATEVRQRLANAGMQILGLFGQLQSGCKWAELQGRVDHLYRDAVRDTILAGTSEVMRNIIAIRGLGLPR